MIPSEFWFLSFLLTVIVAAVLFSLVYSFFRWRSVNKSEFYRHKEKMAETNDANWINLQNWKMKCEKTEDRLKLITEQKNDLDRQLRETRTLLQLAYESNVVDNTARKAESKPPKQKQPLPVDNHDWGGPL